MPAISALGNKACAPLTVAVGGVAVTLAQVDQAAEALEAWPSTTIKPVLGPLGNPLAECDYRSVAAPYKHLFPSRRGQRGASGQPSTKLAFIYALRQVSLACRENPASMYTALVAEALAAFGRDERYAAEIAREAVRQGRARHQAAARARLRSAIHRAVSACEARAGEFTCTYRGVCGTGSCRFAAGDLVQVAEDAVPGRLTRPANHVSGASFDPAAPLAAYLELRPYIVGVKVASADAARGSDANRLPPGIFPGTL